MTITRCPSVRGLVCLLLAAAITGSVAAPAEARGVRVRPFTLARVNSRCFFAPSVPAMWPIKPLSSRPPDPRRVQRAPREPASLRSGHRGAGPGPGLRDDERHHHGHRHSTFRPGALPPRGDLLVLARHADGRHHGGDIRFPRPTHRAHVRPEWRHVHLSQFASCGLVDPRRPTGPLHDPANTERPAIGELSAFVANANAYRSFKLDPPSGRPTVRQAIRRSPSG